MAKEKPRAITELLFLTKTESVRWDDSIGDFGFVVAYNAKDDHWFDFRGWLITGVDDNGLAVFDSHGSHGSNVPDEDYVDLKGFIKWDHCSEWQYAGHICEVEDVCVNEMIRYCYKIAADEMPHWD